MRPWASRMRVAAHEALERLSIENGAAAGAAVPSEGTAGAVEGIAKSSKRRSARAGAEALAGAREASGPASMGWSNGRAVASGAGEAWRAGRSRMVVDDIRASNWMVIAALA